MTIPNSVTYIGESAFDMCKGLISVVSLNPTPPTIERSRYSAFDSNTYSKAVLQVPKGSANLYKAAEGWQYFENIEELDDETGIEDVMTEKVPEEKAFYNLNGLKVTTPQKGINIIRKSDNTVKKVYVK